MRKYLIVALSVIAVTLAFNLLPSISSMRVEAASKFIQCESIRFLRGGVEWNPKMLDLRDNGTEIPVTVDIAITVVKPADFDDTYDYVSGYRFWTSYTGLDVLNMSELANTNRHTEIYPISIHEVGTWYYSFETVADNGINVPGGGPGCPPPEGDASFEVVANTAGIESRLFNTNCSWLYQNGAANIFSTHFNCDVSGGQGIAEDDGSVPEAALARCVSGVSLNNATLSNGDYCYPKQAAAVTQLQPLEQCIPNSSSLCPSGYECLPTTGFGGDPASHRCINTSNTIRGAGELCHLAFATDSTYQQCRSGSSSTLYYCLRDTDGSQISDPAQRLYLGTCRPEAEVKEECNNDLFCITQCETEGGKNCSQYKCVLPAGLTLRMCEGPTKVDPGEGNGGLTVTPTNGVCNCPGASKTPACDPANPQIQDERNNEPGLRDRFFACVRCVGANNTWTDSLGCVETTASGLFTRILQIALGVVGGITLLRLIILGYQYNFSDKKADIKTAAKDVIATLGGLLLILFSVVLLRIIGVNILDIVPPGFFGT